MQPPFTLDEPVLPVLRLLTPTTGSASITSRVALARMPRPGMLCAVASPFPVACACGHDAQCFQASPFPFYRMIPVSRSVAAPRRVARSELDTK